MGVQFLPATTRAHDLIQAKEIAEIGDISPPGSPREEELCVVVPRTVGKIYPVNKHVFILPPHWNRA